ncbi:MAG: glycosyltransferase family 1 protein, partial [Verrucomicrobia bacterium]|nr:glycosyltransferase family 1 protein [Verrucomicrobiota bacterium]
MYSDVARWAQKTMGLTISRFEDYFFLNGQRIPTLYSYSQQVLPTPADWPPEAYPAGYMFVDRLGDWTPPPALEEFLAAGPPPVYVGFSSMVGMDPKELTRRVLGALERAGARAVLATGWGGLQADEWPESVFAVESVPHDWLFPRMAAIVHHGGGGSTAMGLRLGQPAVICPFVGDQPFWGELLAERGFGPKPIL